MKNKQTKTLGHLNISHQSFTCVMILAINKFKCGYSLCRRECRRLNNVFILTVQKPHEMNLTFFSFLQVNVAVILVLLT